MRPVILREGFIKSWDDIQYKYDGETNTIIEGEPLKFSIQKQVATNIRGFVINNGYKYTLLFGSLISVIEQDEEKVLIKTEERWGWMAPGKIIFATPKQEGQKSSEKNQIVIFYQDIEGNKYKTIEDENFQSLSFRQ